MKAASRGARAAVIAVISSLLPTVGCDPIPTVPPPPPPEVTVARPVRQDVTFYHDFTGTTGALNEVEIRARVQGFLQSIDFEDAAVVKKDQLLFVIDPAPFEARRDRALADKLAKEAILQRAEAEVARAEKAVRTNAISEEEVARRRAEQLVAEADVKAAVAALAEAELDVGYTQVRSPIDGRVSRHLVDVGNLVGSAENTLLTTVRSLDPIEAYFEISERLLLEALRRDRGPDGEAADDKPGVPHLQVFLGLTGEEGHPHEGELNYVDSQVDETTGTVLARAIFKNPDNLLWPGAYARIRIPGKVRPGALLVEEKAIGTDLGGKYLLLVGADNVVEHRSVRIGPLFEGKRVILDGLEPDDTYIVDGLLRARPGLPVTPTPAKTPAPAGAGTEAGAGAGASGAGTGTDAGASGAPEGAGDPTPTPTPTDG